LSTECVRERAWGRGKREGGAGKVARDGGREGDTSHDGLDVYDLLVP
jgi:hypothetical protein